MDTETSAYLRLMGILAAVIVFAFVAVRYWLPRLTGMKGSAGGPIRVVARLPLEPRRMLYIVQAGSDYLMLATSEAGVHYLTSLDGANLEGVLASAAAQQRNGPDVSKFGRVLRGGR